MDRNLANLQVGKLNGYTIKWSKCDASVILGTVFSENLEKVFTCLGDNIDPVSTKSAFSSITEVIRKALFKPPANRPKPPFGWFNHECTCVHKLVSITYQEMLI